MPMPGSGEMSTGQVIGALVAENPEDCAELLQDPENARLVDVMSSPTLRELLEQDFDRAVPPTLRGFLRFGPVLWGKEVHVANVAAGCIIAAFYFYLAVFPPEFLSIPPVEVTPRLEFLCPWWVKKALDYTEWILPSYASFFLGVKMLIDSLMLHMAFMCAGHQRVRELLHLTVTQGQLLPELFQRTRAASKTAALRGYVGNPCAMLVLCLACSDSVDQALSLLLYVTGAVLASMRLWPARAVLRGMIQASTNQVETFARKYNFNLDFDERGAGAPNHASKTYEECQVALKEFIEMDKRINRVFNPFSPTALIMLATIVAGLINDLLLLYLCFCVFFIKRHGSMLIFWILFFLVIGTVSGAALVLYNAFKMRYSQTQIQVQSIQLANPTVEQRGVVNEQGGPAFASLPIIGRAFGPEGGTQRNRTAAEIEVAEGGALSS